MAALVTAVATIVGAGFALVRWLGPMVAQGGDTSGGLTARAGQVLVEQGSAEADDLIRGLVESQGDRIDLNAMVIAGEGEEDPQWFFSLWYNCSGLTPDEPPGEDKCDRAWLYFDDQNPSPPSYDNPSRVEMVGTWANNRETDLGFGAAGLELWPVKASG